MLGRRWRSDECRRRSVSAVRHRIDVGGANLVARRVESALLALHQPPSHRRSTASASKPAQEPTNDDPSAVTFTRGCSKRYQPCDMARGSLRPPESLHELSSSLPLPPHSCCLELSLTSIRRPRSPPTTIGCDLHAGLQQALSAMRHGSREHAREPSASGKSPRRFLFNLVAFSFR